VVSLLAKKQKGQRISVVTAYDYPSALHVGQAGIDICLVGDSVGMVELGHETTQKVTMDMMIHHCLAASRGLSTAVQQGHRKCMLVGDMPFGTYEYQDTDTALRAAYRFVQEGNCDAVKLEVSSKNKKDENR
jgi:3-methyl-2-oxobutanoate hydroxymethyltransferase